MGQDSVTPIRSQTKPLSSGGRFTDDGSRPESTDRDRLRIQLLGGFAVIDGTTDIELPTDMQRVVAFLALQGRRLPRIYVAGTIWPDSGEVRAFGNLRTSLWRLRQQTTGLVTATNRSLSIAKGVIVDVDQADRIAQRLFSQPENCSDDDLSLDPFVLDLLTGWYEEWAVIERERVYQQSLHALEVIADSLMNLGRYPEAIEAALAALRLDPLRESAHRCLVRIHLREGNRSEAIREFKDYRELLAKDLGLSPSRAMYELVARATADAVVRPS